MTSDRKELCVYLSSCRTAFAAHRRRCAVPILLAMYFTLSVIKSDLIAGETAANSAISLTVSSNTLLSKVRCTNNGVSDIPAADQRIIASNGGKRPDAYKVGNIPVARSLWGRNEVICVHPKSPETSAMLDLTEITKDSEGTIKLGFHSFPSGDCQVIIEKAGNEIQTVPVAGSQWKDVSLAYSHEAVVLRVEATGWSNEHAFITVALSSDAVPSPASAPIDSSSAAATTHHDQPSVVPTDELVRQAIRLVQRPDEPGENPNPGAANDNDATK